MTNKSQELAALISKIETFAKKQLENSDISGPRFGAYVKLSWCAGSGEPCNASCQSIIDALKTLREHDDIEELNEFYVAMTAYMLDCFPDTNEEVASIDHIRKIGNALSKVA